MINERIRKAIHCIEDSISRYSAKSDRQHYNFNESFYCYAVADFSRYFGKENFGERINQKLEFFYENSGVVSGLNDVLFVSCAAHVSADKRQIFYSILEDRADSYIQSAFEALPVVAEKKLTKFIYKNIKAYLPHIIKIEDYCSFMLYFSKKFAKTGDAICMERARQKTEQYTTMLYKDGNKLIHSSYDATKKSAFPCDRYLLSATGYYLLGLGAFIEMSSNKEMENYKNVYASLCKTLAIMQKSNGYFNVTDDISPIEDKKDGLATLLISAVFFAGVRQGIISNSYYDKAVKAFNVVVDGFKLKDGLLSMPYISYIGNVRRYFSLNINLTSTAYSDKESGLGALALASMEYSKCSDEKKLD